jgi:PKD repeat protein
MTPVGGTAPLTVSFNADASNIDTTGVISSYRWDFGDGGAVAGTAQTSHQYASAGTYNVTLTAINSEGTEFSLYDKVYVYSAVLDNSHPDVTTSSDMLFSDNFEYRVDRNESAFYPSGVDNPFHNTGGWTAAKAVNVTGSHYGYLYTTMQIPGYAGVFPGDNPTGRVLVVEARAGSMCSTSDPICQTDFWLQYGDSAPGTIPADVWFQFWIYSNRYNDPTDQNDQISAYANRSKFLYPCNDVDGYPCENQEEGNLGLKWLFTLGHTTGEPYWANDDITEVFMTTVDPYNHSINFQGPNTEPGNRFKIGQNDVSDNIRPHRWTLVKLHFDTSGTQGIYEAWIKPLGGSWLQVADWRGGVTADFTWPLTDVGGAGGHKVLRMPTTIDDYDSWIYLDDFVMAASENGLPEYTY